jgi:hypothetical protein
MSKNLIIHMVKSNARKEIAAARTHMESRIWQADKHFKG